MIEVKGNIDNLQSSIDFYLNITSKEEVMDSRFMRDRFFEIFDREESCREESFLVYSETVTDDYKVNTEVEPELFGDEEVFDGSFSYFSSSKEDDVKIDNDNTSVEKDTVTVETETSYEEDDSEFVQSDYIEEPDDLEEEDDFNGWGSSYDDEEEVEEVEEEDFSNWGSFGEDEEEDVKEVPSSVPFEDDLGFFNGCFEEDTVVKETKNVVVDLPKKSELEVTNVPTDLRDFVKMYPNCELSFVYKYFTKKEVEKQLKMGRVFKRKNKLMI